MKEPILSIAQRLLRGLRRSERDLADHIHSMEADARQVDRIGREIDRALDDTDSPTNPPKRDEQPPRN